MADQPPTIIKRKKVSGGDGHHGGAWKVAYADFVTAMMAFFLLMWLLNATTEKQKQGLADYFDSRIPIARVSGGGRSAFSGDSLTAAEDLAESGGGVEAETEGRASGRGEADSDEGGAESGGRASGAGDGGAAAETRRLDALAEAIGAMGGGASDELLSHVRTRVTDEGLVIDVFDTPDAPLFGPDDATPTPIMRALTEVVAEVAGLVTNDVAITGHVGPLAGAGPEAAERAWRLSSERAQAARRLLGDSGLAPDRVAEVAGRAGGDPASADPEDPANRRVQITFLRDFPLR